MLKEFNNQAKTYSMYRTVYRTICSHISCLNDAIDMHDTLCARKYATEHFALKLFNYTFVFEGYTDCLYDLRLINDVEYNAFYEFCKAIRLECNPFM